MNAARATATADAAPSAAAPAPAARSRGTQPVSLQRVFGNRRITRQFQGGGNNPNPAAPPPVPPPAALTPLVVDVAVTLLNGVSDTVARDVARAIRVWTPASISFNAAPTVTLTPADTTAIVGADNKLDCNHGSPAQVTTEETTLFTHRAPGVINVFYVPGLSGCNDAGYTVTGAAPDPMIVMDQSFNAGATIIGTLEHELGHALGLPHRGDAYQLMHDGLRAGDNLIPSEIATARSGPYAHAAAPPPPNPTQPNPQQPANPPPSPPLQQPPTSIGDAAQPRWAVQIPVGAGFQFPLAGSTSIFRRPGAGTRSTVLDQAFALSAGLALNYSFHRTDTGFELALLGQASPSFALGQSPPTVGGGTSVYTGTNFQLAVQPALVFYSHGRHQFSAILQAGGGYTTSAVAADEPGTTVRSDAATISAQGGLQYAYSLITNRLQLVGSLVFIGSGSSLTAPDSLPSGVNRSTGSLGFGFSIGLQPIIPLSFYR